MSADRKAELRDRRRARHAATRPIEERFEEESDTGDITTSDDDGSDESSTKCGSSSDEESSSEAEEGEHVPPVEVKVPK